MSLKYLIESSKWRFELGIWEVVPFGSRSSCYLSVPDMDFWLTFSYFVPYGVIENRVTKVNFKYFNGSFAEAGLFEKFIFELHASSYSFKITCILSRQVISLKKIVVSSAKFTILMSRSPICIPLILYWY